MKLMAAVAGLLAGFGLDLAAAWEPLWPAVAPGGNPGFQAPEQVGKGGRVTHVAVPQYQVYLPPKDRRSGAAVVIFPGGGYALSAMEHEGKAYANWLMERGIVAVVVKYRVSSEERAGYRFPVPLLDARRALRTVRARAGEWGVDPAKVGVMGSSAGGHLAAMCATMSEECLEGESRDQTDALPCRPDFAVLVYPVITMSEPWGHMGSKHRLLGGQPDPALAARVSNERRVNERVPPCFLVHAADDPGVPARNSLEFAARCAEARVPVVCHLFASGGHGFGLHGRGDSAAWPGLLESWLAKRGLLWRPRSSRDE